MNDLVSSNQFVDVVDKIINLDKLSHSYLIEINSLEDIQYVYLFIKLILCQKKNKRINNLNCSECNICRLVDSNNYPDLKIIDSDGKWIKKSQLLELKADFQNKSLFDNKKIYVIKYAEDLNLSSSNSILKFLEEPEDDIIAILLTKNRYKVINTITSRCQVLSLKKDDNKLVFNDVAISFIKYLIHPSELFIHYKYLNENIFIDRQKSKDILLEVQNNLLRYLDYRSNNNLICDKELLKVLNDLDPKKIIKYLIIIEEEILNLVFNVNLKIWLDRLFSRFVEVK